MKISGKFFKLTKKSHLKRHLRHSKGFLKRSQKAYAAKYPSVPLRQTRRNVQYIKPSVPAQAIPKERQVSTTLLIMRIQLGPTPLSSETGVLYRFHISRIRKHEFLLTRPHLLRHLLGRLGCLVSQASSSYIRYCIR